MEQDIIKEIINSFVDSIKPALNEKIKQMSFTDDNTKLSLTPKETAEILGIGTNTIYNLLKDKDFPSYQVGNKWYVSRKGLDDWIDNQIKNK